MSYLEQTTKEIIEAYTFLRAHNHSIPSETLEFMKDSSIAALKDKYAYPAISSEKFQTWLADNDYVCVYNAHNLKERDQKFRKGRYSKGKYPVYDKGTLYSHYRNTLDLKQDTNG